MLICRHLLSKDALSSLRNRFKSSALKVDGQYLAAKETLDRLKDQVTEKKDDLAAVDAKIRALQEQYEAEKEVSLIVKVIHPAH